MANYVVMVRFDEETDQKIIHLQEELVVSGYLAGGIRRVIVDLDNKTAPIKVENTVTDVLEPTAFPKNRIR